MGRLSGFLRRHGSVLAFLVLGAGTVTGWLSLQAAEQERHDQVELDEARRCVGEWGTAEQIRDSIEEAARIPSGALIEVANEVANDDLAGLVERYESLVDAGVEAARDGLHDPGCDLHDARTLLYNDLN